MRHSYINLHPTHLELRTGHAYALALRTKATAIDPQSNKNRCKCISRPSFYPCYIT